MNQKINILGYKDIVINYNVKLQFILFMLTEKKEKEKIFQDSKNVLFFMFILLIVDVLIIYCAVLLYNYHRSISYIFFSKL